jgi:hypothetical protein
LLRPIGTFFAILQLSACAKIILHLET